MYRLYRLLLWLADRILWLACFVECPRNPESVRRSALRSMELIQDRDIDRLFGSKVMVAE
jgi:hypothetical protein